MSEEKQNHWALDINGKRIHISQAESGRNGYYCPACGQEMLASLSEKITSHYKHDYWDVERRGQCTYSNETYRHKIGKEILQRIKSIKVPALYKYPPKGQEGKAMFVRKGEVIHANTVEIEIPFFEDEYGQIKWGRNHKVAEENLFIQPDVAFFDKSGTPILLIELVATHKPDDEKQAKLRRLGINTVLVSLPKGNEEEIEATFAATSRTKWAYHYEEEITQYIPFLKGNQNPVPEVDEDQRRLFDEGFNCRASEIKNLLRSIRSSLGGEHYREAEARLREEISRVTGITERESIELQGIRAAIRERLDQSVGDRRGAVDDRRRALQQKDGALEKRYYRRQQEIEEEERRIEEESAMVEKEIRSTVEGLGGGKGSFREQTRDIEERIASTRGNIQTARDRISEVQQNEAQIPAEFELAERKARADADQRLQQTKREFERRSSGIRDEQDALPGRFEEDKAGAEAEESEYLRTAIECIQSRTSDTDIELPGRYLNLLKAGGIFSDYNERYQAVKRLVAARRSFKSGAYKRWYKSE